MSPYDSFSFATAPYYREARVTTARRQTACRMRHYCTRRIDECLGRRKSGCTATRLAERHPQGVCRIRKAAEPPTAAQQRIIEAEASRIAEPMAVSVSNTATQAVAFRRQKAPSSPRLPIKFLSLGGQRGIFSFRGKRISPLFAPLRVRRECGAAPAALLFLRARRGLYAFSHVKLTRKRRLGRTGPAATSLSRTTLPTRSVESRKPSCSISVRSQQR